MPKLIVAGGARLVGESRVLGAKNAVLPILAACVLTKRAVLLTDCPELSDVTNMLGILSTIGCKVEQRGGEILVDAEHADRYELPEHLSKELRSSIFLLGPVLGRFRRAVVTYPGGCEIGNRPIDLHIKGLAALNASIREDGGRIYCDGTGLAGASIHLDYPSVGATENIMMAATAAKGETVIRNAAREPEIVDLQNFLCAAGFHVSGAGSSTIVIRDGYEPREVRYRIMPDRIAAGTMLVGAAITRGEVTVTNVVPDHMEGVLSKLTECGCALKVYDTAVTLVCPNRPRAPVRIETMPHPGFPTDMQAQMFALATIADGTTVIVENVFENRFRHATELARMGGVSIIRDRTAIIHGVSGLSGAVVKARDLRGGAALVLAGLAADGITTVCGAEMIARGYEKFEEQLTRLGANVTRRDD